ncbi:MAG TPA: 4Fe-4S dicluster domain-containing protein [Paludibacteraceae bacterium]|nr:4Fe-4S dicluster domain-containing protein [Paludibacteraceae bacterium]
MTSKINPAFQDKLKKYGAVNFNACYNCGTCTAVCSLSTPEESFPREMVRLSSLGLENDIKSSLKPWECYYCGECTENCPQTANPGELMMSLRRWLTAVYDWTGLSGLLYRSLAFTISALSLVLIGVLVFGNALSFQLTEMMHYGHLFEMYVVFAVLVIIFIPNIARMLNFTILKPKVKANLRIYIKSLPDLFIHMFTQKRAKDCDKEDDFRWLEHFILVLAYLSLLFTTVFLNWFGTNSFFVVVLGYVESFFVFVITTDFVSSRIKKAKALNKFSQPSDWLFVIWLMLMGLTAFLVRVFIDTQIIDNNVWMYIVHLTVLAQWAVIIVPFGKWSHFLYRSFGMYFSRIKTESEKRRG